MIRIPSTAWTCIMYLSSQWMMTVLVQNHLFVSQEKTDWLTSVAPLVGCFFPPPSSSSSFTIMFTSSDAEWMHMFTKAIDHMATRALFSLPSLSLGVMSWLRSELVRESRALSSCWDCLCRDDKGLWVIRLELCRQSLISLLWMLLRYVGAFYPFVMSLPELPHRLALCCWWITGCPVSSSSFDKVICALVF